MNQHSQPPRWATRLLHWLGHPDTREEVEGDLLELYAHWVRTHGPRKANWHYTLSVLRLLRPLAKSRHVPEYTTPFLLSPDMLRNYVKIAWRNLIRHKVYSAINIGGLAVGMAVAMLIGLWVWDELSFNKSHPQYDRIAQVLENQPLENGTQTFESLPFPLSTKLRRSYASDFKYVAVAVPMDITLAYNEKKLTKNGRFSEAAFPELLTLTMLKGSRKLTDPTAVLLAQSTSNVLFGAEDPINKIVDTGDRRMAKVTGVYEDLPRNSQFNGTAFIAPFALLATSSPGIMTNWKSSSFPIYVQLNPASRFEQVSAKISHVLYEGSKDPVKPTLFLWPMRQWHLYADFKNGVAGGGRVQFVWLFSIIGIFVLLLACINFMNLSTARSQKRAKEVGIRKVVGSVRGQLISQFLSESVLVVAVAFILSMGLVWLSLSWFNQLANKQMAMLWTEPLFWLAAFGFSLFTALIAGSYPAFYLSSFRPVKVLKGVVRVGRLVALPRQLLVVLQFTVSVTLIIGTIIVFRQIQHAKNRPIGYNRNGLIAINTSSLGRYDALRLDLLQTGAVVNMAESSNPTTDVWSSANNLDWRGKDSNRQAMFGTVSVSEDFGKTIGWTIKEGRGFSRKLTTDSLAFVFNEAAVKLIGIQHPVGEIIRWHDKEFTVIGVVHDLVMQSPFEPVKPMVFMMNNERTMNTITIKINPEQGAGEALATIRAVFQKYNPTVPFDYKFADQEFATKFSGEERIGNLASIFAILAVFISCLGLFGLASFMAEARTKEIGVRKVLGASVVNLWSLLSKDFVVLVGIAFCIATPIAYYFLNNWLQQYQYRTEITWWIFVVSGLGALGLTLLTVSYQSIRAALMNPVKSLRSE
ncbi:ABC transporter permease [Fibrella sp. HMF5335]|uniref:ABC transporter permease n=1 Tax=Fibrella rubiginis TaxID=2817060 RepID=A0A939K3K8_9BACT|nr:ABC transporter permease [Fibrella rubiginis]MBO0937479.1 ABC transporter permease [Fibrella rubiginis]